MLTQQIQKGENKKLELKEKLPSNEAIVKTVIAFSNISGGKLVIGVNDKREVIGVDEEENFEFDLDSLDLDIIYNEFKKIGKSCDFEKLKNLKLIKQNNNQDLPTNALCITLGEFDNTLIKCARFKGVSKEIFIDKKEFNGNLFENLENTLKFLQNHLNLSAQVEGLQLKEELEIPLLAIREALLNAIIHRDYTRNSDIKVAIYDDIVEIVSPGNFPNGLTLEDVKSGGIRRIPTNTDELSLEELKIIDFLEQNQKITVKDVQNLLTLKTTQSKEILYSLAEKNYIKKIGKTRGSYYILKATK